MRWRFDKKKNNIGVRILWNKKYKEELEKYREQSIIAGGQVKIDKQHAKGKMTARERIEYLLDEGTFQEVGSQIESRFVDFDMDKKKLPGDGVVIGFGTINGQLVYVASEDFTVIGGTLGEQHSKKIVRILDMAMKSNAPFITINDSGGARIEEGIAGLQFICFYYTYMACYRQTAIDTFYIRYSQNQIPIGQIYCYNIFVRHDRNFSALLLFTRVQIFGCEIIKNQRRDYYGNSKYFPYRCYNLQTGKMLERLHSVPRI